MWWSGPYMSGFMWIFPMIGLLFFIVVLFILVQFLSGRGICGVRPKGYQEEDIEELKKEIKALREEIKELKKKE